MSDAINVFCIVCSHFAVLVAALALSIAVASGAYRAGWYRGRREGWDDAYDRQWQEQCWGGDDEDGEDDEDDEE